MKLRFLSVSMRNFLSYGNHPTVLRLDEYPTMSVIAKNGSGKTALTIDSIKFAATGKLMRPLNKNQIVNSVNLKNCEVVLEFEADDKHVKIVRGISPDVFDIEEDGVPLFTDLSKIQKQKSLEGRYKLTDDVIENVLFVSEDSTPFMEMDGPTRRTFVEKVLNMTDFDTIHREVKEVVKRLKPKVAEAESAVREADTSLKRFIEVRAEQSGEFDEKALDTLKERITKGNAVKKKIQVAYGDLKSKIVDAEHAYTVAVQTRVETECKIEDLEKSIEKHKGGKCHACGSDVPQNEDAIKKLEKELSDWKKEYPIAEKTAEEKKSLLDRLKVEAESLSTKHDEANEKLEAMQKDAEALERKRPSETIDKQILELEEEHTKLTAELLIVQEEMEDALNIDRVLKSGVAKAPIIKEYIPFFNRRVNEYLEALGLPCLLEIDKDFNERFRSRNRENFSHHSFSTGQRARLNFAILLTWRDISAQISSINSNLLIIDEFASKLDDEGADSVVKMLNNLDDTNVICIAPREIGAEFSRYVRIDVQNGFSVVTEE